MENFVGFQISILLEAKYMGHQHGRRFIVYGHQYGRRDVMLKHSISNRAKRQCYIFQERFLPPSPLPFGVRGHAPPENCKILHLQGCVFQYSEAAENAIQLPKKDHIKLIAHIWGHLLFSDHYMECMLQRVRKGIMFHRHK